MRLKGKGADRADMMTKCSTMNMIIRVALRWGERTGGAVAGMGGESGLQTLRFSAAL